MAFLRYHVIDSLEEWLAIKCDCVEIVVLHQPKVPRFEFNIKILVSAGGRRDLFIPGCAIAGLKEVKNYVKCNNILYRPSNHVKFAFDYIDSVHCFKLAEAPQPKRQYPQPADLHVAQAVATQLFDPQDVLGAQDEDKIVYYYLSVLRAVNHPVINIARSMINFEWDDQNLFDSALVPQCERPCLRVRYYSWYADLLYFLGLMAPPIAADDTVARVTEKVRARHDQQLASLCAAVGITDYEPMVRGQSWPTLKKFLEASPIVCRLIAASVLKSLKLARPLTVIEDQVVRQLKQLWQWTGLYDFRDCYEFAVSAYTEAHRIPVVAAQCQQVKQLYENLRKAMSEENLIPYARLLVDDGDFFKPYDVDNYPDLFYATRSKMVSQKSDNALWEEFVATRPVTIPRKEIDAKLWIAVSKSDEPEEPDVNDFDLVDASETDGLKEEEAGAATKEAEDDGCPVSNIEWLSKKLFDSDTDSDRDCQEISKKLFALDPYSDNDGTRINENIFELDVDSQKDGERVSEKGLESDSDSYSDDESERKKQFEDSYREVGPVTQKLFEVDSDSDENKMDASSVDSKEFEFVG